MGLMVKPIVEFVQEHVNLIHLRFLLLMELDQECLVNLVTWRKGHLERLLPFHRELFEIIEGIKFDDLVHT